MEFSQFISKWSSSGAAERANKDAFLLELCDLLGVSRPDPATGDPERDLYVFERDAVLTHEGGRLTIGKIDLYKHGCFLLEAKQGSEEGSKKIGTARRGTPAWNIAMRDALGQGLQYARTLMSPPPFLITCDIGYCFDLYATFDGSWNYRPFPDGQSSRIYLKDLSQFADRLRAIFTDPASLDPSRNAARVTRQIAEHIAELAQELEKAGHDPERVATFLMRCLFTLFAEDVGLLPGHVFTETLEKYWLDNPPSFPGGVSSLWEAMNEGTNFLIGKLKRFNGGLFAEQAALPLTRPQLERLLEAAQSNWSEVEPAIFGTLLERALDPRERHRLGAHYTPRAYVERLVRPTIEEPLRQDWDGVRAEVRTLVEAGKIEDAKKVVRAFHGRLTKIRVLDPACGSGNFLYVSLDLFKRLESEVLGLLADLGEKQSLLEMERVTVTPEQFRGIEVKRWAKEIAELVLWIGYLQWQVRAWGSAQTVPEPVLHDYGNIEHRDAVLAWDRMDLVLDEKGVPVTRWDGITMKISPVTGEKIPDEAARMPVYRYINPRRAEWPRADFIIGNPPYIGARRIRLALGDEYVDVLREAYPNLPETSDLVMYWWHKAALSVESANTKAFGMITTNSITQEYSRPVIERHVSEAGGVTICFAIPDHPWAESADGAAVRVAMTVGIPKANSDHKAVLGRVVREDLANELAQIEYREVNSINSFLRPGSSSQKPNALRSNIQLCFQGVVPAGDGFKLSESDLRQMGYEPRKLPLVIRKYVIGRDLVQRPPAKFIIDFFGHSEADARRQWPNLYQHVLDRVYPERVHNKRKAYRDNWWLFAEPRPAMRRALKNLKRFIVTPYTAKFRPFLFISGDTIPDAMAYAVASDDAYLLGVLSSRVHVLWALTTGGRLGVGNDPRYTKNLCFDPFPFPVCTEDHKSLIRDLGEALDAHRKCQQALHPDLTLTGMYNVLEKLRSGEPLNAKDKVIHEEGLVSILKQIHDDLDDAVFDAYGWPRNLMDEENLERLVALNAERVAEERNGLVRWLRPEFQNPTGAREETQAALPGTEVPEEEKVVEVSAAVNPWPKRLPEQIGTVRFLLGERTWDVEKVARMFKGARRKDVEGVLDSLAALGLAVAFDTPKGRRWRGVDRVVAVS